MYFPKGGLHPHVTTSGSPHFCLLGLKRFEGGFRWRYPSKSTLVLGGCGHKSFRQLPLSCMGLHSLQLSSSLIGMSLQPLFPRGILPLSDVLCPRGKGADDQSLGTRCDRLFSFSHRHSSLSSCLNATLGLCRIACHLFLYFGWEGFSHHYISVNFLLQ